MELPVNKTGTKTNNQTTKYHLDDSERKLPRPIVFWSDNEKDAFRRNKVVQTRYHMLLNDIEIQQKSSQKTIRHEAHKFRRRYKAELQSTSETGSSAEISCVTGPTSSTPIGYEQKPNKEVDSSSDSESDGETWSNIPQKGVITKMKKSNVKFSVSTADTTSDEHNCAIEQVKLSTDVSIKRKNLKIRSQSAVQTRTNQRPSTSKRSNRSKSAMLKLPDFPPEEREKSTLDSNSELINKNMPSKKPNSIFFDRSQAAYQLRKELQKLAKVRKHGVVKVAFTIEDAIREERDKLQASSKKVAEYIQRLEIDQRNMKIDDWTSKTIDPVLS